MCDRCARSERKCRPARPRAASMRARPGKSRGHPLQTSGQRTAGSNG
ncbi:Hypothetical protein A7982_09656 [Minicystis rosea]|nr:Hypothetical protein A7982_09656 [Minicystis rosea]